MKLTFLILSVAVFFNLCGSVRGAENYSLWPRRPAELEQARQLVREQKLAEAVKLLQPFVGEKGIAGREARQICGEVNVRRYLSRLHPGASVCRVKKGDTMARLAAESQCPSDVIMLLNGIVEPSILKVGQKLVIVRMELRAEIHPTQREISVWDGNQLVADYDIISVEGEEGKLNEETAVSAREGYLQGAPVPVRSSLYPSSDRVLRLQNGWSVTAGQKTSGPVIRLEQKDLTELALLLRVGARVSIVRDEDSFMPTLPEPRPGEKSSDTHAPSA